MDDYKHEYYILQQRLGSKVVQLQRLLADEEKGHDETWRSVRILAALLAASVAINVGWLL